LSGYVKESVNPLPRRRRIEKEQEEVADHRVLQAEVMACLGQHPALKCNFYNSIILKEEVFALLGLPFYVTHGEYLECKYPI
jgi:hypothetical protein